jgi:hypothetical protein
MAQINYLTGIQGESDAIENLKKAVKAKDQAKIDGAKTAVIAQFEVARAAAVSMVQLTVEKQILADIASGNLRIAEAAAVRASMIQQGIDALNLPS